MEALVEVAEVAFVVAVEAIAETATEATVAAAVVATAGTGMEAIGVAEEVATVEAEAVMMEVMVAAMTRDPIRRILWLCQERTVNFNNNLAKLLFFAGARREHSIVSPMLQITAIL